MKTSLKLLVLLIPLLTLGGCYTQLALRDSGYRERNTEYDKNEYAYEDQVDSTFYYDDSDSVNVNEYYNDESYNSHYRRYLWGYYPTFGFSSGNYHYPYYDDFWGWQPYISGGYYWPWYYPYHYYSPFYYPYYSPPYYPHGNNSPGFRGRSAGYGAPLVRSTGGERGRTRTTDYAGDRSRPSSSYSKRNSDKGMDVDLGKVRVSTDRTNSSGNRVSKDSPSTNTRATRTRDNSSSGNSVSRPSSSSRDNGAVRGRSGTSGERSRAERGSSGSSNSGKSERPSSSYSPRSEPRSAPSYSPPPSSSSPRSDGGSGSRSGSSDSGGRRR